MNPEDIDARLELAVRVAREAGQLTLQYFRRDDLQVELKQDASPVTVADRQAEHLVRERIAAIYPQDAILGEELPPRSGTSGFRWIVDPIDGTKSFIRGVPLYGTLLGVEHQGHSLLGVIYMPGLDEYAYAARGRGAWHVERGAAARPARVSSQQTLSEALFCTSDPRGFERVGRQDAYTQLNSAARLSRSWGDCYGYLLVATGRAEVMVDPIMSVWDACALQPILEEAGGTFTDWKGQPTIHSGEGIGTNKHVLDEVLNITRPL